MFNHGKFNRLRFNLPEASDDVSFRDTLEAAIDAETSLSYDIYERAAANEKALATVHAGCRVYEAAAAAEIVKAAVSAVADYFLREDQKESFGKNCKLSVNCYIVDTLSGKIVMKAHVGEDVHIIDTISGTVDNKAALGVKYLAPDVSCFEIVNCLVSTAVFDTVYITLDVSIPAKGKLVIDSENFIALLNGANVLDRHEGEWLDLSRAVEEIRISGGAGALRASMLYTERFL